MIVDFNCQVENTTGLMLRGRGFLICEIIGLVIILETSFEREQVGSLSISLTLQGPSVRRPFDEPMTACLIIHSIIEILPGARLPPSFLIGKSVDLATQVRICLEALFPAALFPEPERSKEGRAMMILRSHRTAREKLNLSLRVKRCDPSRRSTSLSHSRKKGVARTASRKKWSSRFKGKKLCSLKRSCFP